MIADRHLDIFAFPAASVPTGPLRTHFAIPATSDDGMKSAPVSPILIATLWMVGTLLSFSGMAIAARQLSFHMGTFEILTFRSGIGLIILLPLVLRNRGSAMRTTKFKTHLSRNVVHFAAQYGWVLGVALLPLAEVFALEFTMPIWAAILAVIALGERMTSARIIAIIAGFAGVLIIVRPGHAVFNPASIVMLGAAFGFATSVIWAKILVRTDSALTVIFYMTIIQLPMGLVPALFEWVPPVWANLPWFLIVGAGGLSAHYTLARALKLVDATIVLPIDFLRLPLIAFVGFALYGEALDLWVFLGAALIFGGGYHMVWRESRETRALAAASTLADPADEESEQT